MDFFIINVILLLLALIGSILAVFGKTLSDFADGGKTKRRLTRRGWAAIMVILATFIVGSIKERRDAVARQQAAADQKKLSNSLSRANSDLARSIKNLTTIRKQLAEEQRKSAQLVHQVSYLKEQQDKDWWDVYEHIQWVLIRQPNARKRYDNFRKKGRSIYQAIVWAQQHNPNAQKRI